MKEKTLEELREELNKLIQNRAAILYEGEILKVSQELDELILKIYKE